MDERFVADGLQRLDPLKLIARSMNPAPRSAFGKVAALEASLYMRNQLLRDTDWASMAHSLEVRVPLVDAVLLGKLAGIGLGTDQQRIKSLLAEAPKEPAPSGTIQRRKTGFAVPIAKWI